MKLTTHLHLVLRLRMHGDIPPLTQDIFMVRCSVKAWGQLYLYLSFQVSNPIPIIKALVFLPPHKFT